MVKVSLRVYNREIEGMIEGGHLDEAIAHCQHILKTFPMHVETYKLLGKSFLEARRYTDAADIFQRALMSVPDDFVSHVGMSIIRDDEGKLDDAIWHMERAFEGQPSNPAIQGELRRLYGRRDGVEPPKIRLSRDALANMYAQGELFNQAIAEIRTILAEDANRPDLQVMLARAYYRSGQKVEAAEMAANLLKKYTYCMDALRILVDVLPGSAGTENTMVYRQRLRLLDPYSSFATDTVFNTDHVPDTAVNLERLEFTASVAAASLQPNWASSLGIKLSDEKQAEPAPDWLKPSDSNERFAGAAPVSSGHVIPSVDGQSVPDWISTGDMKESSGITQEGSVDNGAEQPEEQLAKADIPEWLKAMAPKEIAETDTGSEPTLPDLPASSTGDIPDWLAGTGAVATEHKPGPGSVPSVVPPSGGGDIPEWLSGIRAETRTDTAGMGNEPSQPAKSTKDNGVFPDWLKEMGEKSSAGTEAAFAASALEQSLASNEPAQVPAAEQASVEPAAIATGSGEEVLLQKTGDTKPLTIEDDTMAWLESLAAKQGAKEEELLTRPEDRSEEVPDWIKTASESPDLNIKPGSTQSSGETIPMEAIPPQVAESVTQEPVHSEEFPSDKENGMEDIPSWLHAAEEKPPAAAGPEPIHASFETPSLDSFPPLGSEGAVEKPTHSEELPVMKTPLEGITSPKEEDDDTLAWLEDLELKQSPSLEEVQTNPIELPENLSGVTHEMKQEPSAVEESTPETPLEEITITSWLSKHDVEEALRKGKPGTVESQPEPAPPLEIPDWLKDLEKSAISEEAPKQAETLPDWLRKPVQLEDEKPAALPTPEPNLEPEIPTWTDEEIPVSEQLAATTPEEWIPLDEQPGLAEEKKSVEERATKAVEIPDQLRIPKPTGILSRIPSQEKEADSLAAAQTALEANNLKEAMQGYTSLIKKNRLLDAVIHDLQEAIYRFPVDIIVWQTLGDACMRANHLQDALDAYTKAEELLR